MDQSRNKIPGIKKIEQKRNLYGTLQQLRAKRPRLGEMPGTSRVEVDETRDESEDDGSAMEEDEGEHIIIGYKDKMREMQFKMMKKFEGEKKGV